MAFSGSTRSRNGIDPARNTLEKVVSDSAPRRSAPRPSRKRMVGNLVVMSLAGGIVATMAIPAYAFTPGTDQARFGQSASAQLVKDGAQTMQVNAQAATVTVARDGFTATTHEELVRRAKAKAAAEAAKRAAAAQAAAEAAQAAEAQRQREEATQQMSSYASSYTGPSVKDYLAAPAHPGFDLASVYNTASQYQGVPYVFGGATPAGFDCSGFVMYVYAQYGISLPHSASGQAAAGTRIDRADAQPGDLVIMDGHDGFYAGNGNILHAPYEGASVRVQPIWTDNYYIVRLGI